MKKILFTLLVFSFAFAKAQTTRLNQRTLLDDPNTPAEPAAKIVSRNADGQLVVTDKTVTQLDKQNLSEFTDDIGATDPIVARTYFVDIVNGDDATGQFENANRPYKTIDAVLDLFTRNSTDPSSNVVIELLTDGYYPILNQIGYYDLEIKSKVQSYVDFTNLGGGTKSNLYYAGNVSGTYLLVFDLPKGGIVNLTTDDTGGYISSEDLIINLDISNFTWNGTGTAISSSQGVYTESIRNFNSFGRLSLRGDVLIENLVANIESPLGNANVTVNNLVTNDIVNLIPGGTKWTIGNIEGDLDFVYTHGKTYDIEFNNTKWTSGQLNFWLNNGDFTFTGIVDNIRYDSSKNTSGRSDRPGDIKFINFTCLNWTNTIEQSGSYFKWSFINSFIKKGDNLPLIHIRGNTLDTDVVLQKTSIITLDPNTTPIVSSASPIGKNVNIEVGGLETNASSITDTPDINVKFNVLSFKDKSKELVVRSKIDIINKILDPSLTYIIDGDIELLAGEFIQVPAGGNLTINGYGLEASKIIKNVPGEAIFTSPTDGSGGLLMDSIKLVMGTDTTSCFDLVDENGFNAVELVKVNFEGSGNIGTLDGYRQALWNNIGVFGLTDGLTFKGSWLGGFRSNTVIVRALGGTTGTLFKKSSDLTFGNRFYSNANVDLPGGWSLLDFENANFTNPETLQLNGVIITREGVSDLTDSLYTPNITEEADASKWSDNIGLPNSAVKFQKLRSPDGTVFKLEVDNSGNLTTISQ